MDCDRIRRRLAEGAVSPEIEAHLQGCPRCDEIATRWAETRRALREHRSEAVPGPDFSAGVARKISADPGEPLRWAVRRLLPMTAALVLVLSLLAWREGALDLQDEGLPEQLAAWLLDTSGIE